MRMLAVATALCVAIGGLPATPTSAASASVRLPGDARPRWHTAPPLPGLPPALPIPPARDFFAPPPPPPPAPSSCTGVDPVVCQYDVAPGFYRLAVDLVGGTSITVEARRTIYPGAARSGLWHVESTISVRNPEGQPTGSEGFGTPGLTVRFAGAPTMLSARVTPVVPALAIFLVGDSTVADLEQVHFPKAGWGQEIAQFFGPDVAIANYADSGESAASYLAKPELFDVLEPQLTGGALVLIQFGHNDRAESAGQYRGYLTEMVARVRARGATPVLVTSPVTRHFHNGRLTREASHADGTTNYPAEMKRVAADHGVPLIDLTAQSRTLLESLGEAGSTPLYASDNIHPTEAGSKRYAEFIATHLRDLHLVPATALR